MARTAGGPGHTVVVGGLYFPFGGVINLLQHVHASRQHEPSGSENEDGLACPGALVWVSDGGGVYLMSGGLPSLLSDLANESSNIIVHAQGWRPEDNHPYADATVLGGDDFAEHLHASDISLKALIGRQAAGYCWLVLNLVDADTVSPGVARSLPDDLYAD